MDAGETIDYLPGYSSGNNTGSGDTGDPYNPYVPQLTDADRAEWMKMTRYTAAPAQQAEAAPWWQNLVAYGITKAVDNTFPSTSAGVQGNTAPGSFAGQNGRSYNQAGPVNAAPVTSVGQLVSGVAGMSPLMLAALAAGVFFLLKK